MGTQLSQKGHSPQFSAHARCGQMAGWIKVPLGTEVGLGPRDIVLDEDSAPPPHTHKGVQPLPQFLAHVCCGETARWINMPLDTEVGLGPGHIVLDRDLATPVQRGTAPNFQSISVVAKRLDGSRCYLVRRWASA